MYLVRRCFAEIRSQGRCRPYSGLFGMEMVVHHYIFENAVHIIARFAEWDFFDPFHHINAAGARIALGFETFVHIARTSIIGSDRQGVAAVEIIKHSFNIGGAKCNVVIGVDRKRVWAIRHGDLA